MNTELPKKRIGQIRDIIENTPPHELENIVQGTKDSSKSIILAVQRQNSQKNNSLKTQLKSFIHSYVSGLNEDDIYELISNLNYYEHIFDELNLDSNQLDTDYYPLESLNRYPLNKRIERLLMNGVLLPVEKLKKDFNAQMYKILDRLNRNVEKEAKKSGLTIEPLNAKYLFHLIRNNEDDSYNIMVGAEINSYLKSINFSAGLEELRSIEVNDDDDDGHKNHMRYQLEYTSDGGIGVSKDELISFLKSEGYKNDGEYFAIYGNDYLQINIQFLDNNISLDEDGKVNEKCVIDIYSKAKSSNITSEQYIELSIPILTKITQDLANKIYREFGSPKLPYKFSLFDLLEKNYQNDGEEEEGGLALVGGKEYVNTTIYKGDYSKSKINNSDIILEDSEMLELEMLMEQFKNEQFFKEHGADIAKGTVLHGPPGTGKTLFARVISESIDAEFMVIKLAEILNKYEGGNERNIQAKINEAKKSAKSGKKVIMFFDEADILFEGRGGERNNKEGIVSILLQELDGIHQNALDNIFIFFTTNRLNTIDTALLERLDKKIKIGLPNAKKRIEHFKLNISKKIDKSKDNQFGEIDYDLLSKGTEGKSGRIIMKLVNNAVTKFAHNRLKNPDSELISTKDILDEMKLLDTDKQKTIGFIK